MKTILTILLILIGTATFAQSTFIAYKIKGDVRYETKTEKKALLTGTQLKDSGALVVPSNARVQLICSNYAVLTIDRAGRYAMRDLQTMCKEPDNAVSANYFKYVWNQFSTTHASPEDARRHNMSNLGGVVRGCPGITFTDVQDTIRFYKGHYLVRWTTNDDVVSTKFMLFTTEAATVPAWSIDVISGTFDMDSIPAELKKYKTLYWSVSTTGKADCEKRYIELWSKKEFEKERRAYLKNFRKYHFDGKESNEAFAAYLYEKGFTADADRVSGIAE